MGHDFNTCRFCRHFNLGKCSRIPIYSKKSAEDYFQHAFEDGELYTYIEEHMPNHLAGLVRRMLEDSKMPTKWKKEIIESMENIDSDELYGITDMLEPWIIKRAEFYDSEKEPWYIDNHEEFSCKYCD